MGTPEQNFPAWITAPGGQYLIVQSQAEKDSLEDGRAVVTAINSAQGTTYVVTPLPPKPAPTLKPRERVG